MVILGLLGLGSFAVLFTSHQVLPQGLYTFGHQQFTHQHIDKTNISKTTANTSHQHEMERSPGPHSHPIEIYAKLHGNNTNIRFHKMDITTGDIPLDVTDKVHKKSFDYENMDVVSGETSKDGILYDQMADTEHHREVGFQTIEEGRSYVFSAYIDDRTTRTVRALGLAQQHGPDDMKGHPKLCTLWYRGGEYTTTTVEVERACDNSSIRLVLRCKWTVYVLTPQVM